MHDDTILTAIDEAIGATTLCSCGMEFHLNERNEVLWLECPTFSASTRLPARLVAFFREMTHDRRAVAALPSRPVLAPVSVTRSVPVPVPAVARG
jgi:hypothetical protein